MRACIVNHPNRSPRGRSVEILRGDADQWIRRSDQETAASGWPSLTVNEAEFGDEWPFRDDRVTIECRDGLFCIVNIGGYDFARQRCSAEPVRVANCT